MKKKDPSSNWKGRILPLGKARIELSMGFREVRGGDIGERWEALLCSGYGVVTRAWWYFPLRCKTEVGAKLEVERKLVPGIKKLLDLQQQARTRGFDKVREEYQPILNFLHATLQDIWNTGL